MSRIFAFMTGNYVDPDSDVEADFDERGWIDPSWSTVTLFDNRNDVSPLLNMDEDDPDLQEYIDDITTGYTNDGDGTFYSVDSTQDMTTGWHWSYAIHFKRKFFGPKGWTEENYVPEVSK